MAYLQRLIILCGVFLGLHGFLGAAEREEPRQIRALWVDGRRAGEDLFVADAKGQPQKLAVGVGGRGAPVFVGSTAKPITLLRRVAPPAGAAAAAKEFEPAGEIAWPAGSTNKALLLIGAANRPGAPLAVRGVALADDTTVFPVTSLRFVNFLGAELTSRLGDSVKPLAPGVSAAVPYPVEPKPDAKTIANFPLGLARAGKEGKTDLIFNGRIDAWPRSRTLVIVLPGATAEADPVVRTIVDTVPAPAASAQSGPRAN